MSLTEFDQEEYDRNRYEEGREAGLQEGKQVGPQEGKVAGKLEGFIETAKKLLQINMPVALITDITGLSAEQLNKLAKS